MLNNLYFYSRKRTSFMNQHIINALSNYDFKWEKNSGYGHIDGYEVNVFLNKMAAGPVFTFSTFLPQTKKNDFMVQINSRGFKLVQTNCFDYGVMVMVGAMTAGGFEKKITEVLPVIIETLNSLEAPKSDICPQSGEVLDEVESNMITIPDSQVQIRLSNKAIEAVNSNIAKSNEEFDNAPNNYAKGFVGIAIGALAGVAVTVIMALIGYVTALSAWVSIFLGITLYKKFGGKPNKMMIVMSFATTTVFILGSLFLMYVIVSKAAAVQAGVDMSGFEALSYCLDNSEELRRLFTADILLTAFFILLAQGFSIYSLRKMIKRPKNIQ